METNFYDETKNFIFVKKGTDGSLLDHIFIHLDETIQKSFLAYYESYSSDVPLKVFKFEEVVLSEEETSEYPSSLFKNFKKEQMWSRLRVSGALPSQWRIFFESLMKK